MLDAPGVRIAPDGSDYQAVILTPTARGVRADGVLTESATDVLRHGLAWLGGDFRDGPSETLATAAMLTPESAHPIGPEPDGATLGTGRAAKSRGDVTKGAILYPARHTPP